MGQCLGAGIQILTCPALSSRSAAGQHPQRPGPHHHPHGHLRLQAGPAAIAEQEPGAAVGKCCRFSCPVLLPGSAARFSCPVPSWPDASPASTGGCPVSCAWLSAHAASRGSIMTWLSTTAQPGAEHRTPVLSKLTPGTASPADPVGLEQGSNAPFSPNAAFR